jgi:hypothetical protein
MDLAGLKAARETGAAAAGAFYSATTPGVKAVFLPNPTADGGNLSSPSGTVSGEMSVQALHTQAISSAPEEQYFLQGPRSRSSSHRS